LSIESNIVAIRREINATYPQILLKYLHSVASTVSILLGRDVKMEGNTNAINISRDIEEGFQSKDHTTSEEMPTKTIKYSDNINVIVKHDKKKIHVQNMNGQFSASNPIFNANRELSNDSEARNTGDVKRSENSTEFQTARKSIYINNITSNIIPDAQQILNNGLGGSVRPSTAPTSSPHKMQILNESTATNEKSGVSLLFFGDTDSQLSTTLNGPNTLRHSTMKKRPNTASSILSSKIEQVKLREEKQIKDTFQQFLEDFENHIAQTTTEQEFRITSEKKIS
jgi:hypothetical protein